MPSSYLLRHDILRELPNKTAVRSRSCGLKLARSSCFGILPTRVHTYPQQLPVSRHYRSLGHKCITSLRSQEPIINPTDVQAPVNNTSQDKQPICLPHLQSHRRRSFVTCYVFRVLFPALTLPYHRPSSHNDPDRGKLGHNLFQLMSLSLCCQHILMSPAYRTGSSVLTHLLSGHHCAPLLLRGKYIR